MPRRNIQTRIEIGKKYLLEMPCSEVCMHMRVSGLPMFVELLEGRHAVQLYHMDHTPFSAPILPGEAGILSDEEGFYAYLWKNWDLESLRKNFNSARILVRTRECLRRSVSAIPCVIHAIPNQNKVNLVYKGMNICCVTWEMIVHSINSGKAINAISIA